MFIRTICTASTILQTLRLVSESLIGTWMCVEMLVRTILNYERLLTHFLLFMFAGKKIPAENMFN